MMNTMMQETLLSGTARKAEIPGWMAAGKTGTSQDFRDAWFIGYTANLVTGVWLGNDDNSPTKKATGGGLPVEVWTRFMKAAHQGVPVASLPNSQAGGGLLSNLFQTASQVSAAADVAAACAVRRRRSRKAAPIGRRRRAPQRRRRIRSAAGAGGGTRWLAGGPVVRTVVELRIDLSRHTPRRRGIQYAVASGHHERSGILDRRRSCIGGHRPTRWRVMTMVRETTRLNPRSRSDADRCRGYRASVLARSTWPQILPTTRQNRAEWFISTRCATSWAAR